VGIETLSTSSKAPIIASLLSYLLARFLVDFFTPLFPFLVI